MLLRTHLFFFSASVSGVGKRKEVPEKKAEKNAFLKEKHTVQLDGTTGVGKSRVASMAA